MPKRAGGKRARGHIRKRGESYQVLVYGGIDPLTHKEIRLVKSTTDRREADRILDKMLVEVAERQSARTRVTLGTTIDEWLKVHEAEQTTLDGYRGYVERTIRPALGDVLLPKITVRVLEQLYAELRRCSRRCQNGEPAVDHRTAAPHECRSVRHRRRPGRPSAGEVHDCAVAGCEVIECPPHRCKGMAASTILQIHWILSAALDAAVRWDWISSNPAEQAKKPRQRAPQPEPPSPDEAARIIERAWEVGPDWGTFVWLVMVTGMRRAEIVALRWSDIDLDVGMLYVRHNYVRSNGRSYEKDTKTHQMRRLSIDEATVEVLREHWERYGHDMVSLREPTSREAYVFSYAPMRDRPYSPSGVTHKYSKMCADLEIDSHLHALRHYSATELLTAGVDLRTVAGRLGHGGGGATTLRVYAAFVGESDRRAAEILGGRMKRRISDAH